LSSVSGLNSSGETEFRYGMTNGRRRCASRPPATISAISSTSRSERPSAISTTSGLVVFASIARNSCWFASSSRISSEGRTTPGVVMKSRFGSASVSLAADATSATVKSRGSPAPGSRYFSAVTPDPK
jgi:hypothetical protein